MKIRHDLTLYLRPLHILSQKEKKKKTEEEGEEEVHWLGKNGYACIFKTSYPYLVITERL